MCLTLLFGLLKSMDERRAEDNNDEKSWPVSDLLLSTVLVALNVMPFIYAFTSTTKRWFDHRKTLLTEVKRTITHIVPVNPGDEDIKHWGAAKDQSDTNNMPVVPVVNTPVRPVSTPSVDPPNGIMCTSRKQLQVVKKKYGPHSSQYKLALKELGKHMGKS